MIEVDKPTAAETEPNAPDDFTPAEIPALHIPPLELQPGAERNDADRYHLDQLTRYHDRAFVVNAYAALRKRPPTDLELTTILDDLRSGRRGKIEIIESLLATQTEGGPRIHVEGLPSPLLRRVSRWPLLGYSMRLLSDLRRLPMLIRHQQQFEAYSMAQQQRIADHINDVVAPFLAGLSDSVDDANDSILMLADSLVDLSGRQSELLEHLQTLQAQLENLQVQRERSEAQLHANLVALTEAHTERQQQVDDLYRKHDEFTAAQQEFLVQEQRVIVEAQKVAVAGLMDELQMLAGEQEKKRTELAGEVRRLRGLIGESRADGPASSGAKEREKP
jgi:hypothetical protein